MLLEFKNNIVCGAIRGTYDGRQMYQLIKPIHIVVKYSSDIFFFIIAVLLW